jgi:hypothetical protein
MRLGVAAEAMADVLANVRVIIDFSQTLKHSLEADAKRKLIIFKREREV